MIPFGDRAVRFDIPAGVSRRRLFTALSALPGVQDVVLAEDIGCVVFTTEGADARPVRAVLDEHGRAAIEEPPPRTHTVDVLYDGEDLDAVARAIGRSKEDVVALHSGADYRVAMLGFMPGFAYLVGLPGELRLPRRAPRQRVPRGSVAIAAEYTGIYPFASPGGWHLLGRARRFQPFLLEAGAALAIGDAVRFVPSSDDTPEPAPAAPALPAPSGPHLEITRAAGIGLLVDGGRPGRMHEGVPPGGPLVRSRLSRANALAGNEPGACAIELSGTFEVVARGGSIVVADDLGDRAITLAEGDRHVVSTEGRTRVRYLAVAGGIDAPVILGGRGALLVAGIGELLRKGARLGTGTPSGRADTSEPIASDDEPIAVQPGPDAGPILETLASRDLRIAAASDRTGTRLEGLPEVAASAASMARRSSPMVTGAIELTPSGPIVLGPDHPTTGGYPVVGVVRSSSLDRLFAKPIGALVRLRIA